jgi:glycosyltransferase involved in cell wall biosynthesis
MAVLFLVPPERRPYELLYFSNFASDVSVAVDEQTYFKFKDWFSEFRDLNAIFLRRKEGLLSNLFHSTAGDFTYDEEQLLNILKEESFNAIVTVELFSFLSKQASLICTEFSIPHVVVVWENISSHPFYHLPPFKENTDFVSRNASKIVAVTNKSKNSLIDLKIPTEKIKVIYPGVFLDKFKPRPLEKEFSVLFVGGLEKHKGFHLLLNAFASLCEKYDNLTLGVVGNGKLKNKLLRMGRKYGEERFVYLGTVPHSKIHLVYPKAELFCFPSLKQKILNSFLIREEQFGFTLVEAMASGLPVVATGTDVIQEIVGSADFLSGNDAKSLGNTLNTFIEDEALRKKLSTQNRQRAETCFDALKQSQFFEDYLTSGKL